MTLREFIEANRPAIDAAILRKVPNAGPIQSDQERKIWIRNDNGLRRWARKKGALV